MPQNPLPEEVVKAIRQRWGLDENDASQDDKIQGLDLYAVMNGYLEWEGLDGRTGAILAIAKCYGAK